MKVNKNDLLIVVDFQNDFITGSLAIPEAEEIIPTIVLYMKKFYNIIVTMDSHPMNHSSFTEQGGPWPPHCITATKGCEIHKDIYTELVKKSVSEEYNPTIFIHKGQRIDIDEYSGFENPRMIEEIKAIEPNRIFFCGLALDYCVKATVQGAIAMLNCPVYLLTDAVKSVNINPNDGVYTLKELATSGVKFITLKDIK